MKFYSIGPGGTLIGLAIALLASLIAPAFWSSSSTTKVSLIADSAIRRVNAPLFPNPPDFVWSQSAIFWFGKAEYNLDDWQTPGKNYVDVRVGYTPHALRIRVQAIDYFLWYKKDPQPSDDLTQYDGVALYLDTAHDRAGAPQPDDYYLFSGWRSSPTQNGPQYQRQGRGSGSGWDLTWSGVFSDTAGSQWSCNPGPNNNTCGIDFGWANTFTIPWSTLGLSGPPADGTVWGMGMILYDRDDQPPAGYIEPQTWPETLDPDSPAAWAELAFNPPPYQPTEAVARGSAVVRRGMGNSVVEDAWMGGGGTCSGGHMGGSEVNHGDSSDLFVGTETAPTHFPCYNKSFLRFYLPDIPPDQVIISATLTLHHWGNAGAPGQALPSLVHLFTIADDWDEMTIHWNNAPLAQENVSITWIYPLGSHPGWPGVPYVWDATQAVAEAHAAEKPVNLAIYSSDWAQHSSKYLTSSETGDWNAEGRPTLRIVWGEQTAAIEKRVSPVAPSYEQMITYTLSLLGSGKALTLTDSLPAGVSAPGPIVSTVGSASYNAAQRQVEWNGMPTAGQAVTITFPVTVTALGRVALFNTAILTQTGGIVGTDTAVAIVEACQAYLPLIMRSGR